MLTPIDIQKKDFDVKFRGYDCSDVDSFLDMLLKDYEKLYKESIEMKDKISVLTEAVDNYKAMETNLRDSILIAQKTAEEIRRNANEQADTILRQAKLEAEELKVNARNDVAQTQGRLDALKGEMEAYKTQIKSICEGICSMMDSTK